jgi:hypothetical protein
MGECTNNAKELNYISKSAEFFAHVYLLKSPKNSGLGQILAKIPGHGFYLSELIFAKIYAVYCSHQRRRV